jgi:hypothetical protein
VRGRVTAVLGSLAAQAEALGPKHRIAQLGSVLEGELLQQWTSRAQDLQSKGW